MCYSNSLFKIIVAVVICLYFTACENYDDKCIKGNCANGHGTMIWANGDKYVGEFKDYKFNGQGVYTFANGEKYAGEFKDHKAHGKGTHTFPDGSIKRGIWKNNKIEKLLEQGSNNTSVQANGI